MTFENYWKEVVRKYPHLGDETEMTTLSVAGLKGLLEQSHAKGRELEVNIQKYHEMVNPKPMNGSDLAEMLGL